MTTKYATRNAVPPPQPSPPREGSRKAYRASVFLLLAVIACTGCTFGKSKYKFASLHRPEFLGGEPAVPDPEAPSRLVATWTDTVLNRAGQASQRGFGGRLVFFKEESQDPVRVEGQLVIYAFDETDRAPHETQPSRRYIFPREQFVKHESQSKLGPSYSVWLPWDEIGGPQKKISLIARFEPVDGPVVLGEQTPHLLPGVAPPEQQLAAPQSPAPVQQAAYAETRLTPAATPDKSIVVAAAPAQLADAPSAAAPSIATMTVALPRQLGAAPPRAAKSLRDLRTMPTPSMIDQPLINQQPAAPATSPAAASTAPAKEPPVDRAQWLRDSVRATHPARATLSAQPAPGRVR